MRISAMAAPWATALGVRVLGDSSDTFPQLTTYGPGGDQSRYLDPAVIGSHVLVRTLQENTDTIKQARFTATWQQEDLKLDAALSYLDDNFTLQNSNTFTNNFWQAYSGYGAPSGRTSGVVVPTNLYRGTIGTSGFIPGFSGAGRCRRVARVQPVRSVRIPEGLGDPWRSRSTGSTILSHDECGSDAGNSGALPNANPACLQLPRFARSGARSGQHSGHHREDLVAVRQRAISTRRSASMPFHFSAGVRERTTDVSSSGVGRLPILLELNPADPTLLTTTFSDTQPITTESDYAYLLPSLDMKLELTAEVHLRFDASRTLTRPAINFLTPVLNVGSVPRVGALTATGGNPALKPYLSDNFDFAVEWYYQQNSYASVNVFVKDVTNFIVQGTQRQTINDVIDPTTGQPAVYTVSQRVNGPDATVNGFELAWQHVFGDTGFGFNANVTLVDTDKPYDRNDISQSGFAVTGLADSANFVGVLRQERLRGARRGELARRVSAAVRPEPEQLRVRCRADLRELEPADRLSDELSVDGTAQHVLRGVECHQRDAEHAWPLRQSAARCLRVRSALRAGCPLPDVDAAADEGMSTPRRHPLSHVCPSRMVRPVRKIVIVGGGTAGWLTAGVIAAKHRSRMRPGSASRWSSLRTRRSSAWARAHGPRCAPRCRGSACPKRSSSGSAMRRSNKARGSPAGRPARRTMLLSSADASAELCSAQSGAALAGAARKGAASATRCVRRAGSVTMAWRPRPSRPPSSMRSPTMPTIWTPASSRRSCRSIAARSWACGTCSPMCGA